MKNDDFKYFFKIIEIYFQECSVRMGAASDGRPVSRPAERKERHKDRYSGKNSDGGRGAPAPGGAFPRGPGSAPRAVSAPDMVSSVGRAER